jgi:hypothetical protein
MSTLKLFSWVLVTGLSTSSFAAFEFDRPGESISTSVTPVGQVAWEQGLPTLQYTEATNDAGQKVRTTDLNADVLLRTGLTKSLELQLGWVGPSWTQVKVGGENFHDEGLGDISVALKKSIDLNDERLSMAVMAKAEIATGEKNFSNHEDIYSLTTALSYKYDDLITTAMNMRYEYEDQDWALVVIPSVQYGLADKWTGFSELVYRKAESQEYESRLTSGVMYAVNERVQLDASVGVDLNAPEKSYHSGLGVAFLF